jgi:hypothetical protein
MEMALIGRDMLTFSVAGYDYDDSDTTLRLEEYVTCLLLNTAAELVELFGRLSRDVHER